MKKILFFFLGAGLVSSTPISAQTIQDLGMEVQHADVTFMDWDNDGDQDLLISGETGNPVTITLKAYTNNGTGTYTLATVPFTAISRAAFDWNDVNQDGKPDLLASGFGASGAFTGIYTSNGTGTFTAATTTLPQNAPTSGFGDFNNDGYVDIFVFGNEGGGKSKLLLNNKAGAFVDSHAFDAYTFTFDPDVSVVDVDNDKDLDMFIVVGDFAGSRYSRLFRNNNGVFTAEVIDPIEKGYGSSTWGDVNGDGFPDLLMGGVGNSAENVNKYKLYRNNAGTSFTLIDSWVSGQFSTGDGGRFFDWDNDGDLDIIITGWNDFRQATDIFINNGTGTFSAFANNAGLPGVSESSVEVADVDGDTDLDVLITGFSGNDFDGAGTVGPYNRNVALIIKNPSTLINVAPTPPTGLKVTGNQASLLFTWNAATDVRTAQNSLSYNLFLVNSAGKWFYYPLADTTTGKLRLQRMGNVSLNKSWIVKGLPAGTYRWGVQAIDHSYMGSVFAKSSFTINANGTLPVLMSSYTAIADGKKARIDWTTSTEQNNDRFEVERSSDGKNFFKLTQVEGRGTTASANRYTVYDNNPSEGVNYYKLIQYNKDGKPTEFGIRTVTMNRGIKPSITVFPNPSRDVIGFRLSSFVAPQLTVTLSDMSGKIMHTQTMQTANGQGYYKLNVNSKPVAGQYIMTVSGEGVHETLKVVVN